MADVFDVILFDLDGTLTDPGEGITKAVAYALRRYGIEVTDRRELYPFIGPPLAESFMRYFGFSEERAAEAITFYREYYRPIGIFENTVYPGVREMLTAGSAAGRTLAVASSKPEVFVRRILEHFSLGEPFAFAGGANLDETRIRKSEVIEYVLEHLGVAERERVLMVGDRMHDVSGAAECGIPCAGVLYGYGSEKELREAGAAYILPAVEALRDAIVNGF